MQVSKTIRLSQETLDRVVKVAQATGYTPSEFIRYCVENNIDAVADEFFSQRKKQLKKGKK